MKKLSILLCGLILLPLSLQAQTVSEEEIIEALNYAAVARAVVEGDMLKFVSMVPYSPLNYQGKHGKTILHYAVEEKRVSMVVLLLSDISENKEEQAERMCKIYQHLAKNKTVHKKIYGNGWALNQCKRYKEYLESGKEDMRKYLDTTLRDDEGKTALDYAKIVASSSSVIESAVGEAMVDAFGEE